MKYDRQRNALIEELNNNMFCFDIYCAPSLQALDDISLYDKGALTPKSFAKIVRLIQSISIFKINSCLKTKLSQTEE